VKRLKKVRATAPRTGKHKARICLNPRCKIPFVPGHYGDRQKVGSSKEHCHIIPCASCKGSGQKRGERCYRCAGSGKVKQTCQEWYKIYWGQVRQPPAAIPEEIFARIALSAKADKHRYVCMVAAKESAMRKGELLGLTWSDIIGPAGEILEAFNLRGQWDDVEGFKPTKTAQGRVAYFLPGAIQEISTLTRTAPGDRVFPFTESGLYEWFVALQEKLGIVNPATGYPYRWHDIRHTLLTELVHGHGDEGLLTAKELGGHKNIQTTLGYARQTPKQVRDRAIALRKAPPTQNIGSIAKLSKEGS